MAIYDNNGTTNTEIGKLYDNNGSVNSQIGEVYDNNGSSNSLIYSAGTFVYENGKFVGDYSSYSATVASSASGGALTLNTDHMLIKCNNGGHCYVGFNKTLTAPSGCTKICLKFTPTVTWNNANTVVYLGEYYSDKWRNTVKCTQTTSGTPVTLSLTLTTTAPDEFWWGVVSNWDTSISPQIKVTEIWFE